MTNLKACTLDGLPGNLQLPKALTERRYIFLSRSGLVQRAPLQTQLVFTFLSVACANRQCSAGRDMSLPYNARLEPPRTSPAFGAYRMFADRMYRWALNKTDRAELITAIYLHVYENREGDTDGIQQ